MTKRLLMTLTLLATLAAGCGGGDDKPASSDRTLARASMLQLTDFPSGWSAQAKPDTRSRCAAVEAAKRATSGRASSATFRYGDATQAESNVYVFADEAAARDAFAELTSAATRACYAGLVANGIAKQGNLTLGETRSEPLELGELGDERLGERVIQPLTVDGIDLELYLDLVFVRSGRGMALELLVDAPKPFAEDLREQLTRTSVKRLGSVLA